MCMLQLVRYSSFLVGNKRRVLCGKINGMWAICFLQLFAFAVFKAVEIFY